MCIVNKKLKMKLYLIHAWQNEEETRSHGPAPLDPPQAEYHCSFVLLKIVVALIPELGEIVEPELSHLLSELRNRSISEVLKSFQ